MCGIVGAIGTKKSAQIVIEGLNKLEYRGYDSCGIALFENGTVNIKKSVERVSDLASQVTEEPLYAIGHTRWATHGGVNLDNAHPHTSSDEVVTLVHNGVIENYKELKDKYLTEISLYSETDTEIVANILAVFYAELNDMQEAINRFIEEVHGSYALLVNVKGDENLYVLKNKTPIVIGKTDELITIASDAGAVSDYSEHFYRLENKEYAIINKETQVVNIYNENGAVEFSFKQIDLDNEVINLGDYEHFMLKEIEEQPRVISDIINQYKNIKFDEELLNKVKSASEIYIVASGTSSYAGLIVKRIFAEKLRKKVEVVIGSEFGYDDNIIADDALFIFISQSGETADSMIVFNEIKDTHTTLAVTNVKESQLDSGCEYSYLLHAGMEVAVASTKAYTAQVSVLAILVYQMAGDDSIYSLLEEVKEKQELVFKKENELRHLAREIAKYDQAFILGRLVDYDVAKEMALKIKEITYININDYAAGELKHGPIALIDESKVIITLNSQVDMAKQTRSNVEEVRSRGGNVITIGNDKIDMDFDLELSYTDNKNLNALVTVVAGQLISYFIALELKRDVDKPRNLAKSVTVE